MHHALLFFVIIIQFCLVQATKTAMRERVHRHALGMTLHTAIFVLVTVGFALCQAVVKTAEFPYSAAGAIGAIGSFVRLALDTCKAYPTNGQCIVSLFCAV